MITFLPCSLTAISRSKGKSTCSTIVRPLLGIPTSTLNWPPCPSTTTSIQTSSWTILSHVPCLTWISRLQSLPRTSLWQKQFCAKNSSWVFSSGTKLRFLALKSTWGGGKHLASEVTLSSINAILTKSRNMTMTPVGTQMFQTEFLPGTSLSFDRGRTSSSTPMRSTCTVNKACFSNK